MEGFVWGLHDMGKWVVVVSQLAGHDTSDACVKSTI